MVLGTPLPSRPAVRLRFRRNVDRLTNGQLRTFRNAFTAMMEISDDRGYQHFAGIHGLPRPIGCGDAHATPFFLPWHRAYLYFFERALRDRSRTAMLAWWDWTARPGGVETLPTAYTADPGTNPLVSAEIAPLALEQAGLQPPQRTRRTPGATSLPTAAEVRRVLTLDDFGSFNAALEDLHNRVHMWVGGHMGQIAFAAYDPIFWAHHTMVDRVWRIWQIRHPGASPPESILDTALAPFPMTVRQTLDVTDLGYDYAVSTTAAAVRS